MTAVDNLDIVIEQYHQVAAQHRLRCTRDVRLRVLLTTGRCRLQQTPQCQRGRQDSCGRPRAYRFMSLRPRTALFKRAIMYYTSPVSMGKRQRDRQPPMWVEVTDLPTAASHPFYRRESARLHDVVLECEWVLISALCE
jgi:hypothetical protein